MTEDASLTICPLCGVTRDTAPQDALRRALAALSDADIQRAAIAARQVYADGIGLQSVTPWHHYKSRFAWSACIRAAISALSESEGE